jgi:SAM-dependent methyltransferase
MNETVFGRYSEERVCPLTGPTAEPAAASVGRVYKNNGNAPLLALLDGHVGRILDVGCGAGDNARLLVSRFPGCQVFGITYSEAEAAIARKAMTACWVTNIEDDLPGYLRAQRFDVIIFSHVLEHMRDPAATLSKFADLLSEGGTALIAVPNVLSWTMRWRFLRGDFEYQSDGVLDDTHLRFFTYLTAERYLVARCPGLRLISKSVTGSVPQWIVRRYLIPRRLSRGIDRLGCRFWPNLFGDQILLKAVRDPSRTEA